MSRVKELSNVAVDIPVVTGCFGLWGEVELPECIREEVEEGEMMS